MNRRSFLQRLAAVVPTSVIVRELPMPAPPSFHFLDHYDAAVRRTAATLADLQLDAFSAGRAIQSAIAGDVIR